MSTSGYSALTFDAAGTLITVAAPVGETYAEVAAGYGAELDPAVLMAGFREVFPTMPPLAFPGARGDALDDLEREWWETLVRRVVTPAGGVEPFEEFFDELYEYYAHGHAWRAYREVEGVLLRLREVGYRLAVVSNFDSRLVSILAALQLDRLMDAVVYSSAAGAAKPDPAIFTQALAALDVTPGEALHVGDNRRADYDGARDAGLSALLVERGDGSGAAGGATTIENLVGVVDHL